MMDFIKTVKGKIILCLVPAVLLPGIVLALPKASALLKFLTALVPLVSFLVVYFVIKRDLHKVGIQLQGLGAEVVQKTPTDAIVVQKLLIKKIEGFGFIKKLQHLQIFCRNRRRNRKHGGL